MRIVASLKKSGNAKYISHLDSLRVLHRSVLRANIPIAYSQGYSPHPLMSFATALALGHTGDGEWIDVKMQEDIQVNEFIQKINPCLPTGYEVTNAYAVDDKFPAVASFMQSAEYVATTDTIIDFKTLNNAILSLLSSNIIITKRKKSGNKKVNAEVDIRPHIYEMKAVEGKFPKLHIVGKLDNTGALNVDALLAQLNILLNLDCMWSVNRKSVNLIGFNP
ncbi:MAG: DUF2344 domain-containing protein [Clostridiales bacterium]|nr:DUF2344 domain-containing protein [Clostridiales bacterium]